MVIAWSVATLNLREILVTDDGVDVPDSIIWDISGGNCDTLHFATKVVDSLLKKHTNPVGLAKG